MTNCSVCKQQIGHFWRNIPTGETNFDSSPKFERKLFFVQAYHLDQVGQDNRTRISPIVCKDCYDKIPPTPWLKDYQKGGPYADFVSRERVEA